MSSSQAKAYHSITIGSRNTWDNWHLVPTSRPLVEPPSVRTNYIDIPGASGSLDLTEALTGYPTYNNRSGSWEFLVMNGYRSWDVAYSDIMAYLHGKKLRAVLDDDPDYYYEGRFSVNGWSSDKNWSKITINYNVGPYKIEVKGSDEAGGKRDYRNIAVSGSTAYTVTNDVMRVRPVFYASAAMSILFNNTTYQLNAGNNTIQEIVFAEGNNYLTFIGNGTVTIRMHGGRF